MVANAAGDLLMDGEAQGGREPEFTQAPASPSTQAAGPIPCTPNLRGVSRISKEALVCPNQKIPRTVNAL